ncbi:hypothetical protein HPB48_019887 [Haemaphysalis longicornis]|uniref:Uncharacterized protein n=1 Tax=Haemaphysalis longicornis TaxID=44386 RepID=A0A9J6GUG0_HAELO|nr:hypothetical protein HPB48_019887 [Haemaphysalis longicornis]
MPPPPRNLPGPSRGWGHSAYAQARFHPWRPRAPRHRPPTLRTVATWTVVEADRSVGWVSRLPWELQPRPERALHRDCMTAAIAAASASAGPRTEDSVTAAFALLLHHRLDLLRDPLPGEHVIDMPDES